MIKDTNSPGSCKVQRRLYLEGLAERINDYTAYQIEYYEENPDNSIAEYVDALGYGEAELQIDDVRWALRGHMDEPVGAWFDGLCDDDLEDILRNLHWTLDVKEYCDEVSVFSMISSETEDELPNDIQDELDELSESEFLEVRSKCDYYLSSTGYICFDPCVTWYAKMDIKELAKEITNEYLSILAQAAE